MKKYIAAATLDVFEGLAAAICFDTKRSPMPKKPAPKKKRATSAKKTVRLLSGGNPQIAKADGDAPVQAYLSALPGWKRAVGQQIDRVVTRAVPTVKKAVKWNSPFYGIEGQGWFLSVHAYTRYLKLAFFAGSSLTPLPPGASKSQARYLDVGEGELDEAQLSKWAQQAAKLPGWSP